MSTVVTVLVGAGVGVCVLSCVALALLRDAFDGLHAVAPVTSLGVPLVIAGLAVHDGTPHGIGKLVVTGLLLMLSGPAAGAATARAARARQGGTSTAEAE